MQFRFVDQISDIGANQWDSLRTDDHPFLTSAFLGALEDSNSVGGETGWTPMHLIGEENGQLCLAMPLYLKDHSYGEYVFDWQWARAFEHHGRQYFPKLLTAIPFTPATGPRILTKEPLDQKTLGALYAFVANFAQENSLSSWHLLFPNTSLQKLLTANDKLVPREDVQFHWYNKDYENFDDFLAPFRSAKRKQIKRERRKVAEQGIRLVQKTGEELTPEDWQAFYQCYQSTYLKRSGHSGYLNWSFFEQIAAQLNEQVMIVLAYLDEALIASSLFFYDRDTLFGRYWGALGDFDCLHFEACYYQGIDFAIKHGLKTFNPGTQGEHKLVRGFEPTKTRSYHWIADADFAEAIRHYLDKERAHTGAYETAAANHLPFRRDTG